MSGDWWGKNSEDLHAKKSESIVNPAVTDDISKGFVVNSKWTNIVTKDNYVCVDNALGAAVWKVTTEGGAAVYDSIIINDNSTVGGHRIHSVTAGITADVGSAQGGNPITTDINEISICATAGDSITLPIAVAGLRITIINNGAEAADVFPASDDNLGAGVDTAASLAAGSNITYASYNTVNWEVV